MYQRLRLRPGSEASRRTRAEHNHRLLETTHKPPRSFRGHSCPAAGEAFGQPHTPTSTPSLLAIQRTTKPIRGADRAGGPSRHHTTPSSAQQHIRTRGLLLEWGHWKGYHVRDQAYSSFATAFRNVDTKEKIKIPERVLATERPGIYRVLHVVVGSRAVLLGDH